MRIRRSVPSRKMKSQSFIEKRDMVARQVVEYRTKGYAPQDIAARVGVNVRVVERFCQQHISKLYDLSDVDYHRNLHISQLETMLQSRLELAIEGDNNAYGMALKTVEALAGLKGMSTKRAMQGVIEHNVNHSGEIGVGGTIEHVHEMGQRAARAIEKFNAAQAKNQAIVENDHKPRFDIDKTLRKQLPSATPNEAEIVEAEIVEDSSREEINER